MTDLENFVNQQGRDKLVKDVRKKINDFIPNRPTPRLMHGHLWEGNILFKDNNFVGFIDPGSFFGHNEMEIAYLRWFKPQFIDNNFLHKYNEYFPMFFRYIFESISITQKEMYLYNYIKQKREDNI